MRIPRPLPPIPKDLYRLYSDLAFWQRWHVRLRWRLCPFLVIAGQVPRSGRIVDIGCGRGMLANYLALTGPGRRVVGIDKQETRIRAAQATVRGRTNIEFRYRDSRDLEVSEFDCVIMTDFLHHLSYGEQEELLRHCREIVAPGGLLLIEDVGDRPRWKWYAHLVIDRVLNFGRRQNFRRPGAWKSFLRSLGFSLTVIPADRGIPLPDILFVCVKSPGREARARSIGGRAGSERNGPEVSRRKIN